MHSTDDCNQHLPSLIRHSAHIFPRANSALSYSPRVERNMLRGGREGEREREREGGRESEEEKERKREREGGRERERGER